MQISNFIGKPVLSPGGEAFGYVTDVRLSRDYKKPLCLVVADSEEEEIYLPQRTVRAVSDAVIAGKARLTTPTGIPSPVGKHAYTGGGKLLGTVSDVCFGEEPCLIVTEGNTADMVPISRVSVMESVIIYESAEERALMKKSLRESRPEGARKRRESVAGTKREVPHRPGEEPAENVPYLVPPMREPGPDVADPPAPKGFADRTNLLGRYVKRAVYDNAGRPIAQAGECVTPALLSAARRAGKLLALTVNTLTQY